MCMLLQGTAPTRPTLGSPCPPTLVRLGSGRRRAKQSCGPWACDWRTLSTLVRLDTSSGGGGGGSFLRPHERHSSSSSSSRTSEGRGGGVSGMDGRAIKSHFANAREAPLGSPKNGRTGEVVRNSPPVGGRPPRRVTAQQRGEQQGGAEDQKSGGARPCGTAGAAAGGVFSLPRPTGRPGLRHGILGHLLS